ncbi:MAG: LPXTG cell wall anchor domain-containing protein [Aeromicrobium sp.]
MRRFGSYVAASLAILLAAMTPASAHPAVGLSRDGITYSSSLDAPLFDPVIRWVPGDIRTESFYVRNLRADDADLAIDVMSGSVDSLLESGDLMVAARGDDGTWQDVRSPGTHTLVSAVDLASGNASRVDVKVAFSGASTNVTQVQRLNLDVRVRLSQDMDGIVPDDALDMLPDTGAPTLWSLIAGLTLVAGGIVLVQRRREKENSDV